MRFICWYGLLMIAVAGAAPQAQSQIPNQGPGKTSPAMKTLAVQILSAVGSQASGFSPPMAAATYFMIGRTYQSMDPAASRKYFEQAYDVARHLQDDQPFGLGYLQTEIVREMAVIAPRTIENELPQPAMQRNVVLQTLVDDYIKQAKLEHAFELLRQMETEPEVDVAARHLMTAVTPKSNVNRAAIFSLALRIYRENVHPTITAGYPEDLGSLTVRFWKDLPPQLVHEAIDELLKQADPANAPEKSQVRTASMSATNRSGTVTFANEYEFRIFQLLPILRKIDPPEADSLANDVPKLRIALQKYPGGLESLDPSVGDDTSTGEGRDASYRIGSSTTVQGAATRSEINRAYDQIEADAAEHPNEALAKASAIPDKPTRVRILLDVAGEVYKTAPGTANSALSKALDSAEDIHPSSLQWFFKAAELYMLMGKPDDAQRALEDSSTAVLDLYAQDSNSDDPNLALKAYWPSTIAWQEVIAEAAKISPDIALKCVKTVPDDEIRAVEQVFLASEMIDAHLSESTSPWVVHKADLH